MSLHGVGKGRKTSVPPLANATECWATSMWSVFVYSDCGCMRLDHAATAVSQSGRAETCVPRSAAGIVYTHQSLVWTQDWYFMYKVTGENHEGVTIIVWPFHDPCRFKQHSDTYYPLAMHAWLHRGEVRWADKHSGQAHDDGSLRLYTTNSDFSNATLRGRVTHSPQWRGW